MKFKLLSLIATFVLFGTTVAFAASSDILVNIVPPNPAPNENVTINLKSFAYSLDSVLISWSVDGKTVASDIGKKSISVTAPETGGEMNVVATLSLPDGIVESKMTIKPSVMILLYQANDSYVPPFYKGKALPTPDSEVKVVAMPEIRENGTLLNPRNMTYAWKKDYTNNVDGSGYGKNFFLYVNDYLDDSNNISVTAKTVDQSSSTQASLDIGMTEPKILFYKKDNMLGTLWNLALPTTHKIQSSEIVQAEPYFISPKQIQNPALIWSWFINDNPVSVKRFEPNLMPLAVKEGTHGTSVLRLDIRSKDKIFENASKEINIQF